MATRSYEQSLSRSALPLLLVIAAGFSCGCRPKEGIRTYTVATASADAPAADEVAIPTTDRGEPRDRMVAAIVPSGERAWFLKATGPIEAVAAAEPSIEEFLRTVRVEGDAVAWEKPDSWTERGASGMRLATLGVPVIGGDELELSVIGLPKTGDWPGQLLSNVNRWRQQLGLGPWSAAELESETESLAAADGATLFVADGWFDAGGMTPPAADAATPRPPAVESRPASGELSFNKPDGWIEKRGSAMRKASFTTAGGAEVTAFAFPAGAPAMSDPLANVNRWRGEVGLGPTTADDLQASIEEIDLSGETASYIEIRGDEETTLAAMSTRRGRVWFFKLRGPGDEAARQRSVFRGWLESIAIAE